MVASKARMIWGTWAGGRWLRPPARARSAPHETAGPARGASWSGPEKLAVSRVKEISKGPDALAAARGALGRPLWQRPGKPGFAPPPGPTIKACRYVVLLVSILLGACRRLLRGDVARTAAHCEGGCPGARRSSREGSGRVTIHIFEFDKLAPRTHCCDQWLRSRPARLPASWRTLLMVAAPVCHKDRSLPPSSRPAQLICPMQVSALGQCQLQPRK